METGLVAGVTRFEARKTVEDLLNSPLPSGSEELIEDRYSSSKATVYISVPITSGKALIKAIRRSPEQFRSGLPTPKMTSEIVRQNSLELATIRNLVAKAFPSSFIIDPSALEIPDWSQRDYHRFWIEVIGTQVDSAVFADDWSFSSGCCLEFITCVTRQINCLNSQLDPLSLLDGATLLSKAVSQLTSVGLSAEIVSATSAYAAGLVEESNTP